MTFWLNGSFLDGEIAIHIADRGFLLGDGVFETLLVERGAPAFLDEHLARLKSGLKTLCMELTVPDDVNSIVRELAEKKGLAVGRAVARLTATRGVSSRGLALPDSAKPSVLLTLAGAPAPHAAPARLIVSRFRRSEMSVAARCKTLNYLDNVLAKNEALEAGADEAVMLNSHGRVACASAANMFIIDERGAATPPVEEGALEGVVRRLVLEGAAQTGVPVAERPIAADDLAHASCVFLTNSLVGLRPARMKNSVASTLAQAEIFKKLAAWYETRLREDLRMREAAP